MCYILAVARTLFIVSRRHTDLYEYLKERFAGDEQVEVILDRRGAGDRAVETPAAATPPAERRCRPEVDAELRARSHAVVTLG